MRRKREITKAKKFSELSAEEQEIARYVGSKATSAEDVYDILKTIVAPTVQGMLEEELAQHLGYAKHSSEGIGTNNSRNGYSKKILKGSLGQTEIQIPRDRNGEFDSPLLPKYSGNINDLDERVISMYAKGMSTRDINEHISEIYGVDISASMVSAITEKIRPMIEEWQKRPLSELYTVLYMDGIHFKVREQGKIVTKCSYVLLGINGEGIKEILGIWIGEAESSKFWMGVLNEIRSRGVKDILISCIDGLKGFPEAIHNIFPETKIQKCIIHQIRNTTKFIPHKEKKLFCKDLKTIYTALNEEEALTALEDVKTKWKDYAIYLKSWENNWTELSTFFEYPEEIRKIIYTTNTIESLNRQLRKVTKTTSVFPSDESLKKRLYLAQRDISKKWQGTVRNWGKIFGQFLAYFPEEMEKYRK